MNEDYESYEKQRKESLILNTIPKYIPPVFSIVTSFVIIQSQFSILFKLLALIAIFVSLSFTTYVFQDRILTNYMLNIERRMYSTLSGWDVLRPNLILLILTFVYVNQFDLNLISTIIYCLLLYYSLIHWLQVNAAVVASTVVNLLRNKKYEDWIVGITVFSIVPLMLFFMFINSAKIPNDSGVYVPITIPAPELDIIMLVFIWITVFMIRFMIEWGLSPDERDMRNQYAKMVE